MKAALTAGAVLLSAAAVIADMTVVQKIDSSLLTNKTTLGTTMYVKGSQARIDLKPDGRSSLIDLKAGKIYMIDHKEKKAIGMSVDQVKATMEMVVKMMLPGQEKQTFKATGNAKTINGFKCKEYVLSPSTASIERMTCWMAEDVDVSELDQFRAFATDIAKMVGQDTMDQLKGMLIASDWTATMQGKSTPSRMEVQSISRDKLDDAVFALPAGYEVIEMPMLPMMPPGKAAAQPGKP